MLTEGHSRALDRIHCYKLYNKTKWRKSRFSNELLISITLKSFRTNVGPTWYLKKNGWHYIGICRACWTKIEPTVPNLVGPMSKMTLGQRHLSTSGQQNCQQKPTLAQRSIVIWVVTYHCLRALMRGLSGSEFEHPTFSIQGVCSNQLRRSSFNLRRTCCFFHNMTRIATL